MSLKTEILKSFETALLAAQIAGEHILHNQSGIEAVRHKGRVNLVTEVDVQSEEMIIKTIKDNHPGHQILSEEINPDEQLAEFTWIIDPIDGTTNFVHGFRYYCVSIALAYNGEVILGIIHEPVTGEIYSAVKGKGAFLNKKPLKVSEVLSLEESLLATGFPYEETENMKKNMRIFSNLYPKTQGIRRAGSAALDLCYVAAGRFDGFWEFDLNPWDVAAGYLLVEEAGGRVSDFSGNPFSLFSKQILATNGKIHKELIDNLTRFL